MDINSVENTLDETKQTSLNRKQRRAHQKNRGRGLTRQYSSKRARDLHGCAQRKVSFSNSELKQLMEILRKQAADAKSNVETAKSILPSADDLTTEGYDDSAFDLVEMENSTFDLLPDLEDDIPSVEEPFVDESVERVLSSTVKQASELILKGDCDSCLEMIRSAETLGKNRVGVLKAIESRLRTRS